MNIDRYTHHRTAHFDSQNRGVMFPATYRKGSINWADLIMKEIETEEEHKNKLAARNSPQYVADAKRRKVLQKFDRTMTSINKKEDELMRHLAKILEEDIIADLNLSNGAKTTSLIEAIKTFGKYVPYVSILEGYSENQTLVGQTKFTLFQTFFSNLISKCSTFALFAPSNVFAKDRLASTRFSLPELAHIKYTIKVNGDDQTEWYQRLHADVLDNVPAIPMRFPKIHSSEIETLSEEDEQEYIQIENELFNLHDDRKTAAITLKDDTVKNIDEEMRDPQRTISRKEVLSAYKYHLALIKQISQSGLVGDRNLVAELQADLKSLANPSATPSI